MSVDASRMRTTLLYWSFIQSYHTLYFYPSLDFFIQFQTILLPRYYIYITVFVYEVGASILKLLTVKK